MNNLVPQSPKAPKAKTSLNRKLRKLSCFLSYYNQSTNYQCRKLRSSIKGILCIEWIDLAKKTGYFWTTHDLRNCINLGRYRPIANIGCISDFTHTKTQILAFYSA
jgi:hypothetical protein